MSVLGLADKVVAIHRAFKRAKLEHAYGGALALAYYATPRATIDIDLNVFIGPDQYERVAAVLHRLDFDVVPEREVVIRDGQVRTWWRETPVDLFFSYDEVHDAMRRSSRTVPFGSVNIPILAPEHLMVAKIAFNRPKDWLDLEQMLVGVDDLDFGEARRWLHHLMGEDDSRVVRFEALVAELRAES